MYMYVPGKTFVGGTAFNSEDLIDIKQWGGVHFANRGGTFAFCRTIGVLSDRDLPDLSGVTNMTSMFSGASNLDYDLLSDWDVSNVTDMAYMFSDCDGVFNANLSDWNVSNVTDMEGMFLGASSFDRDVSRWDVSRVTNMSFMFEDAKAMTTLPNWYQSDEEEKEDEYEYEEEGEDENEEEGEDEEKF